MKKRRLVVASLLGAAALAIGFVMRSTTLVAAAPLADHRTVRDAEPSDVPVLVELFTSEGCSSCPPADDVLARLQRTQPVVGATIVPLAFHVDYWDRLGWKDRFARAAYTERQAEQQASNGARFSYTPQVVVDGRDRPSWRGPVAPAARPGAAVQLIAMRDGERYVATVQSTPDAPRRLAGYWAVTENGHVTPVKAGENSGVTLRHDFVVREYMPVSAWSAWSAKADTPTTLTFTPELPADAAHPRRVNFVLVDADSGRPVQAVQLAC
jgi:hypothetical protein